MRGIAMRLRLTTVLLSTALLGWVHVVSTQPNPYRLKEPDQKKLCLSCHADFEQTLKKRFVHTPVQAGDCSGCHSPHASDHGKLLADDTTRICATCHDGVVPANARSTHAVVASGECQTCHDPHASDTPANLRADGNDLCVGCHKAIGERLTRAKFGHRPVEQGCTTCHAPHASDKAEHLLKASVPGLCLTCHKADNPTFVARHMKYPVGKASCTSCHDPHGSETPALLFTNVHAPVGTRMCIQCHEAPDSTTPFAVKRQGFELCKGCHGDMVDGMMAKKRLHWPVVDRQGCASCHTPHASRDAKLLRADMQTLCASCHADTVKRLTAVTAKHPPVDQGLCVSCHSPHAADGTFLVDQPSQIELCGTCHDYQRHSAHPIGAEAIDPRNKNLRVDCSSCHRAHGTEHKWMLLAPTNLELCTQCHKQYAR